MSPDTTRLFSVVFLSLVLALAKGQASTIVVKGKTEATSNLFGQTHRSHSTYTTYIDSDRMRQDSVSQGRQTTSIIRTDKKLLWAIDHQKRSYVEMNQAFFRQMQAQMDSVMKNPQAAAMMSGVMSIADFSIDRMQPDGSDTVMGNQPCSKYVGYRQQQKVLEVCVLSTGFFSTARAAQKATMSLTQFMREIFPRNPIVSKLVDQYADNILKVGYPAKIRFYLGKHIASYSEVTELSVQNGVTAAMYEVPTGYRAQNRKAE